MIISGKGTVEFSTGDEVFWKEDNCEIVLDGLVVHWKRQEEIKTTTLGNCLITWSEIFIAVHDWYVFGQR